MIQRFKFNLFSSRFFSLHKSLPKSFIQIQPKHKTKFKLRNIGSIISNIGSFISKWKYGQQREGKIKFHIVIYSTWTTHHFCMHPFCVEKLFFYQIRMLKSCIILDAANFKNQDPPIFSWFSFLSGKISGKQWLSPFQIMQTNIV